MIILGLFVVFLLLQFVSSNSPPPSKINVLFIISDDLRADIDPYSTTYAQFSPNLKRLSESALVFDKAYVQQGV